MNCAEFLGNQDLNILIVKLSAIGDVIHTLPALNALRTHFPEARITWLVEEPASGIVLGHPSLNRVLVSRRQAWVKGLQGNDFPENLRQIACFVRDLRDRTYDVVIDFQGLMKSALMVALSRGTHKIGYHRTREFSYLPLTERVSPCDMDKHAIVRYLNLLEPLGIRMSRIVYDLPINQGDEARVRAVLRGRGWDGRPIVAVNPVAKWETKLWDPARFSELGVLLAERFQWAVVFTGSKADRPMISAILSERQGSLIDLSGETTLMEIAALYRLARCVVSTDTGPMHLAAAAGTPVVALFGPTAPWRTGPFGEGHQVVRAGLTCSPCFRKQCETRECMKQIAVEDVVRAVERVGGIG